MPLVEIEDAVLSALATNGIQYKDAGDRLKKATEIEAAWAKILSGPDRVKALEIYKAQFPDASVPDVDARAAVAPDISRVEKKVDDFIDSFNTNAAERAKKRDQEAANTTVAQGRRRLRTEKQLDDEGVNGVEQIMQDKNIADYEVAYNHWKAQQPPDPDPLPSAYGGARSLDWFQVEEARPDTKLLLTDPKSFQRRETGKVLQEIRDGKLAAA